VSLALVVALVACVSLNAARISQRLRAPSAGLAAWTLLGATAVLGVSGELVQTFKAVSAVAENQKEIMLAAGLSGSLVPLRMALLAALLLLPLDALAAGRQQARALRAGDAIASGIVFTAAALALLAAASIAGFVHDFGMLATLAEGDPRSSELAQASPKVLYGATLEASVAAALALAGGIAGLITAYRDQGRTSVGEAHSETTEPA